jgi:hypothetical protein
MPPQNSPYTKDVSYDELDLLTPTAASNDCGSAVLLEDATRRWSDEKFQFAVRFPAWRAGISASVTLGFGSTVSAVDECWGVEENSASLQSGGNGQPVIVVKLGPPPTDLAIGCTCSGFWQQGTKVTVRYDGSECKPPPPPAYPDDRYWVDCYRDAAFMSPAWGGVKLPPPPPPPAFVAEHLGFFEYHLTKADTRTATAQLRADKWKRGSYVQLAFKKPVSILSVFGASLEIESEADLAGDASKPALVHTFVLGHATDAVCRYKQIQAGRRLQGVDDSTSGQVAGHEESIRAGRGLDWAKGQSTANQPTIHAIRTGDGAGPTITFREPPVGAPMRTGVAASDTFNRPPLADEVARYEDNDDTHCARRAHAR